MNKLTKILFIGLMTTFVSIGAQAQQAGKIAVFSAQNAILGSDMAKQKLEKLEQESEFRSIKSAYDKHKREYDSLIKTFTKESAVMSNTQKAESQKKITAVRADLEHNAKKLQLEQNNAVQELGSELGPRVEKILQALIKEEGIGLLLRAEAVMIAGPTYDITSKVTTKLNAGEGK